jgi:uncharacterized protein with HEPN domain
MRPRDPVIYLRDILDSCEAIVVDVGDMSFDAYVGDRKTRSAVEREFTVIGEALARLIERAPEFSERLPDAPKIIGFRNVIVHGYAELDDHTVWDNIRQNLPMLRREVETLLASSD